ncbi:MAG: hypothetical protein GY800_09155 [Planctomycetes bacterium]|nr:hypothetical protein [Planctomycetota bacterium]
MLSDYTESEINLMKQHCKHWGTLKVLDTSQGQEISVEKHDRTERQTFSHDENEDGSSKFYGYDFK